VKRFNLKQVFSKIVDFRQEGKVMHLMSDIVLTGLFTYMSNGSDYEDMAIFGLEHGDKLGEYLKYPNGVPSSDTFSRVFNRLKPASLIAILEEYGGYFLEVLSEKQINIDGKKLRGATPKSRGNTGIYLVSAWVSENNLCVGQVQVADKSNEITAIPLLLEGLDIKGSIVSMDALGCQTEIVEQICKQEGEYLIGLKGNQETLHEEVKQSFLLNDSHCESSAWMEEGSASQKQSRRCTILDAKIALPQEMLDKWKKLTTLIKIESIRKGVKEERYYISSEAREEKINNPLYFNSLVRGHWGIENRLHWHLDVTFKEDDSRVRKGYAPQNLAILRKMALHLIQNAKSQFKLSIAKIRYKISLNINTLVEILDFSCG
jgi:predicted transposase YbfD/YdcC